MVHYADNLEKIVQNYGSRCLGSQDIEKHEWGIGDMENGLWKPCEIADFGPAQATISWFNQKLLEWMNARWIDGNQEPLDVSQPTCRANLKDFQPEVLIDKR